MEDYQAVCRQLEAVECSIPTVGLVEETEERLVERIGLFQVSTLNRLDTHRCTNKCISILQDTIKMSS